jgi:hypothetical protein
VQPHLSNRLFNLKDNNAVFKRRVEFLRLELPLTILIDFVRTEKTPATYGSPLTDCVLLELLPGPFL